MNPEYFTNSGLFPSKRLTDLPSLAQWDCDEAATAARTLIKDAYDKHAELLDEDGPEPQTKFFIVGPTLHALGYVYSIAEAVPIQDEAKVRADYTLFNSAQEFTEVEAVRGTTAFFRRAVGLCQVAQWKEALQVSDDPETAANQPMVLMDLFLRSSGVDYGIVTNGTTWRMLHRATSDTMKTYVEVDLYKLIEQGSLEDFKAFYVLFTRSALAVTDEGTCLLDSFLPE